MTNKSTKAIFKQSLAAELFLRGHKILSVEPQRNYPSKQIYRFEESQQLHKDIAEIAPTLNKE